MSWARGMEGKGKGLRSWHPIDNFVKIDLKSGYGDGGGGSGLRSSVGKRRGSWGWEDAIERD